MHRKIKAAAAAGMVVAAGVALAFSPRGVSTPAQAVAASAAPVPAEPRPAPVAPVSLQIRGDVVDLPSAAGLAVRLYAGDTPVDATVAPGGTQYVVRLMARPSTPVSVVATAPGIRYTTRLGTAGRLKVRAGGDGIVDPLDEPLVRVSALSTAIAIMKARVASPADDEAGDRANRALASTLWPGNSPDFGDIAQILRNLAMGATPLPAGQADNYAAVTDSATFLALRDATPGLADMAYLRTTAPYAPLASLDALPDATFFGSNAALGPFDTGQGDAYLVARSSATTFRVHAGLEGSRMAGEVPYRPAQPDYAASINPAGELVLVPQGTARVESRSQQTGDRVLRTTVSRTFRRLVPGDRYGLWLVSHVFDETYPDAPGTPAARKQETGVLWSFDLRGARTGLWPAKTTSARLALPWTCPRPTTPTAGSTALMPCEMSIHRLDAGGGGALEDVGPKLDAYLRPQPGVAGNALNWTSTPDSLYVFDGSVGTTYWMTEHVDGAADEAIFLAQGTTGDTANQTRVGITGIVRDTALAFTVGQAAGTWSASTQTLALPYPDGSARLGIRRYDDGTVADHYAPTGLDGPASHPGTWRFQNGRVFDTRYRAYFNGVARYVANCDVAFLNGATSCAPSRVRYFRPLAKVGSRYYGILSFYVQTRYDGRGYTGPYVVMQDASYAIAYDCLAGGCAAPAAARVETAGPAPMYRLHRTSRIRHADLRLRVRRLRP